MSVNIPPRDSGSADSERAADNYEAGLAFVAACLSQDSEGMSLLMAGVGVLALLPNIGAIAADLGRELYGSDEAFRLALAHYTRADGMPKPYRPDVNPQ